jgi:nitrous oxidase accessory protein NosD
VIDRAWWPLQLAAVMTGVGLALDIVVYHRALDYQPGWLALPLGAFELGLVMLAARGLAIEAPIGPAVALFAAAWLGAQVLGHAVLPLVRLTYAQDGGELGRAGPALAAGVVALLSGAAGTAYAMRPPVVHLAAGVHRGPFVIDRRETLVGEPGAVVRGGIVVRASDVTVREVAVVGGENGIEVDGVDDVLLDHVTIRGAALDGIHVRMSGVVIRDCSIDSRGNRFAQGVDVSYALGFRNVVEGCAVVGGQEGIVTHAADAVLRHNRVSGTSLRALTMTEMSMGSIRSNLVDRALGVGILCGDHSMCDIERNVVGAVRPDASGDPTRAGYGIEAHYGASATLRDNRAARVGAFLNAEIRRG